MFVLGGSRLFVDHKKSYETYIRILRDSCIKTCSSNLNTANLEKAITAYTATFRKDAGGKCWGSFSFPGIDPNNRSKPCSFYLCVIIGQPDSYFRC
jgi:hypothetical protein